MSDDRYQPDSDLVCAFVNGNLPLEGDAFAAANRARLLRLLRSGSQADRDWIAFGFGQQAEIDDDEVRSHLRSTADDASEEVRAEAVLALVRRDRTAYSDLVARELRRRNSCVPIFEAAAQCGGRELLPLLERAREDFGECSDIVEAIAACQTDDD